MKERIPKLFAKETTRVCYKGYNLEHHVSIYPKDPVMFEERALPCNPILGMGLRPSILLQGGIWILRKL